MTTIAYSHKDKELAVDSQVTSGNTIVSDKYKKLVRIEDGWVALCGNTTCSEEVYEVLEGNALNLSAMAEEVSGVVMYDNGKVYALHINAVGRLVKQEVKEDYATGSGRDFALGALSVGATATQAVKAAIRYDIYSSGRTLTKKMGDLK